MSKMLKVVGASWLRTKISSYILGILGILSILTLFIGQIERSQEDGNYAATVYYSNKTGYRIEYWGQSNELAEIPRGVARAYFRSDTDKNGWSILEVETDPSYPDQIQAYAAGVVEGALTWYLIHTHLENTVRANCDGKPLEKQCDKLRDELEKSANIWKTRAADLENVEPFWHHVSLHYTQINGIFTGWKYGVQRSATEYDIDISDLYWLNSVSEVTEIQHKLNISLDHAVIDKLPGLSSAFVRIINETGDNGSHKYKLFVAHNAAGSYSSMTRILKRYKLNYHLTSDKDSALAPGNALVFTGYPGSVTSQDEFYIVKGDKHNIVISGTTLKNYNAKLWKEVNITEQVPLSPRITAANHLASNLSTWAHIIASSNSGTACKQWLLVDYSRLKSLQAMQHQTEMKTLRKQSVTEISLSKDVRHTVVHKSSDGHSSGLLWLMEQVPGLTHSADFTETLLGQGYVATYGLPYFKNVADTTEISKMEEKYGPMYSNANSPRATVFKQRYHNATSVETIIKLMRQNNMTSFSNCTENNCDDPVRCEKQFWSVLGVRGDIAYQHKEAYGVIDTKIVTGASDNADELNLHAISSPPFTEINNLTESDLNKGNIASIYTDQFDDDPNISGLKIRNLVKQQQEEAEQESLENLLRNTIQPFQWSESEFINNTHKGLPDKWNFGLFNPTWSW